MNNSLPIASEFQIERSGLRFERGNLHYAWFQLAEQSGERRVRAVAFKELTYLPIETRDDPDLLGKQWAALRGLYNAGVDFLYSAVGVFQPQHLGVVQFYGAAAETESEWSAAEEVTRRMAAVEATLANYPLSRLRQPDVERVRLLFNRVERLPKVLAILGHPDPRQAKRGLGRDGALGQVDEDLASQQGEILLRGLAKLSEDFVFLVTAAQIERRLLSQSLVKMSQIASNYASRQRGSLSIGFSVALPIATAINSGYSSNQGRSDSQAISTADGVSEGWGTSETQSWGHSVGKGQSHGIAHTESIAVTDGIAHTVGRSENISVGHTDSVGSSLSGAQTDSTAHTNSVGHTDSLANTDSTAHTISAGHTDSGAHTASIAQTTSSSHTDSGSHTDSAAHTDSRAHTDSQAHTSSVADTSSQSSTVSGANTTSHGTGVSSADSTNWSTAHASGTSSSDTTSQSTSQGTAHSTGTNWSQGQSSGTSASTAHSTGQSWADSTSQGVADSVTQSTGESHATSTAQGTSNAMAFGSNTGSAQTDSQSHAAGETHSSATSSGVSAGMSSSSAQTQSEGVSLQAGESSSWSHGSNESNSTGMNAGVSAGVNGDVGIVVADVGVNAGVNAGVSSSHSAGNTASTGGGASTQAGLSAGVAATQGSGTSQTSSWGSAQGSANSAVDSTGHSSTTSSGVSSSASFGHSQSSGVSDGTSSGESVGHTTSSSSGHSVGGSSADTTSSGSFSSQSSSVGGSSSDTTSQSSSHGTAHSDGSFSSTTNSSGGAHTTGTSENWGTAQTSGWANSTGSAHTVGSADTRGTADTVGSADTRGSADSKGWADSSGVANTTGSADTRGWADSTGTADTVGHAVSRGSADSVGSADTVGQANTRGWANSVGSAESVGRSSGWFESTSDSHAVSRGSADTESWTESVQESWSEGRAVSQSYQQGRSHGTGNAIAEATSLAGGKGFGGSFSAGMVPGFSLSRAWQTEDDLAIRMTELCRGLESLLNQASMEGGFMTTALLFVSERGEKAAAALAPQAFHGPNVPTPVLTVPGDESLRYHALAFRPSLLPTSNPFQVDLLWTRWGTLLTPGMLAAYTAPNLFEEGTAVTIQEKLPPLAFYPELQGDVILGHLVSPETGELTKVPLKLAKQRHFHTAFVGDTGYGKSVAAERMVYETTLHWQLRTIVLDFGAGWRKLLNAPGLENRVEIRQLSPGGVRPLRWNPLQIGRNILPEVQWRAFCDVFGAIAKLGVKRQVAELREALRKIYLRAGVLVDDPECRADPTWGRVRSNEGDMITVAVETSLALLTADQRQRLAVQRSKAVGLSQLYAEIENKLRTVPPRDSMLRGVLEGILFRLHPLVQGAAASQYAPGNDAVDLNELVPNGYGIAVLEGGAFLDDFSKAVLLGWAAWHLYTDAVIRRMKHGVQNEAYLQIVFEEANKILAGLDNGGNDEESSGISTAEQFANMWRDSRKYGIWLHLITQSPSLIPTGILSSCNNLLVGQVKNAKDRDTVIAALHRSEKGFTDETWRRFLASLPIARSVAKLGYSFERSELEPCYIQPLPLSLLEPSDQEIEVRLGSPQNDDCAVGYN